MKPFFNQNEEVAVNVNDESAKFGGGQENFDTARIHEETHQRYLTSHNYPAAHTLGD
jgi:hypothetical protein